MTSFTSTTHYSSKTIGGYFYTPFSISVSYFPDLQFDNACTFIKMNQEWSEIFSYLINKYPNVTSNSNYCIIGPVDHKEVVWFVSELKQLGLLNIMLPN